MKLQNASGPIEPTINSRLHIADSSWFSDERDLNNFEPKEKQTKNV